MDIAEEAFADVEAKHKDKLLGTFRMVYENSSGKKSERTVDIIRFVMTETKRSFYAYCHLRRTVREFSFKGVRQLFCGDEEIANPQEFLLSLYEKNGGSMEAVEQNPQLDVIRAIWFFARADGVFKRHELNAVKKHALKIMPDIAERLGKDFMDRLETSADDMADIANRLEWTDGLVDYYADAIRELRDLKQMRYSDTLRNLTLIDLWEPFFFGNP